MGFGKPHGKSGILHAHFDGKGHCFFPRKSDQSCHSKAQGIAQAVVQDDNEEDDAYIG